MFLPNETEAIAISGGKDVEEALQILVKLVPLVVITTGPDGAVASNGRETWRQPAYDIEGRFPLDIKEIPLINQTQSGTLQELATALLVGSL